MQRIKLADAQDQLGDLVRAAVAGDTVLIETDDQQVVQLVPVEVPPHRGERKAGSAKSLILYMAADFDAPMMLVDDPEAELKNRPQFGSAKG
jgi:antitoxin (DNA-binding transcriptional repressor) of toxin-antitoxin stability system